MHLETTLKSAESRWCLHRTKHKHSEKHAPFRIHMHRLLRVCLAHADESKETNSGKQRCHYTSCLSVLSHCHWFLLPLRNLCTYNTANMQKHDRTYLALDRLTRLIDIFGPRGMLLNHIQLWRLEIPVSYRSANLRCGHLKDEEERREKRTDEKDDVGQVLVCGDHLPETCSVPQGPQRDP